MGSARSGMSLRCEGWGWAEKEEWIVDPAEFQGLTAHLRRLESGAEHQVIFDQASGRVIKKSCLKDLGFSPRFSSMFNRLCFFLAAGLLAGGSLPSARAADAEVYDVVIYGGTSGGVTAGIQARRMGKSVVLIEPTKFLGGLTTGGLGATDIGNKQAIGGISREFYQHIFQWYADPAHWTVETREKYFSKKQHGGPGKEKEDTMWTFEPHVATQVYADMVAEAKLPVVLGERLDLKAGVKKEGARITEIVMESGRRFAGKVFIDATYEGDLMAKAGVTYHVGREGNAEYHETIDGVQAVHAVSHQFIKKVDPYVKPGDASSGLLPGIDAKGPGEEFSGDRRIQAYNYRMCTTDVPENRLPWVKPEHYDAAWFELALRNVEAGDLRVSWAATFMPNRKTDTNNNCAVSTDFIGMNYDYPDADYATRERIAQEHKDWQMGLLWTLVNSPRVPEKLREAYAKLGLAKDEFNDNGHWPRQMYVREARRMISDYVMTEANCRRKQIVEDSIGMGAYNMDSHNCQRYVTKEGVVKNEGDIQVGTKPYPISYRSLVPKASECTNLVVPVCLSATHIAYGSIRMEPVFMALGQSAATAAVQAVEQNVTVQKIDYALLKKRLLEDKQVLDFVPPHAGGKSIDKTTLAGVVVDDEEAKLTGFEVHGSSSSPFVGDGYVHDGDENKGQQRAVFKTVLEKAGLYEVRFAYPALANRASNVPVTVHFANGEKKILVNEKEKAPIDGYLISLGRFPFKAGEEAIVEVSNEGTDGYVIVDAVQWLPVGE